MNRELLDKYEKLKALLASYGRVAVAYSSGVDSTFLLYAAKEALEDRAIAITARAAAFPTREMDEAREYANELGVRHIWIELDQLSIPGFAENPADRCYICKKAIFNKIKEIAEDKGCNEVCEGSNLDDQGDYRPGLKAIAELGIKSPLKDCGFTKKDIRDLSKHLGIYTWDKQSFACLATRFPYGNVITRDKLMALEKAEQLLLDLGFGQLRVRAHDNLARIELMPEDFDKFMKAPIRNQVYDKFKEYGFDYVALDIKGYRTGSMNETLK